MITTPKPETFLEVGIVSRSGQEWLTLTTLAADSVTQSGTTANRPTVSLWIGRPYFDTTLGYAVWYNGTVWVNSTGTTV